MMGIRFRNGVIAVALVAAGVGLANEGVVRSARSGPARFHEGRARWFAAQALAYRGLTDGVREQGLELSEWHRLRAGAYWRSRSYIHAVGAIEDERQADREGPVARLLVSDRDAREALRRSFERVDGIKQVRRHRRSPAPG